MGVAMIRYLKCKPDGTVIDDRLVNDRDCDNCKHHVTRNGETGCEVWECAYEKGGDTE